MGNLPASVSFADQDLSIINHDGRPWLTAANLALALNFEDTSAVTRIFQCHASEFTDEMTSTVDLTVDRGAGHMRKQVRIFSPRGCHLVARFARAHHADYLWAVLSWPTCATYAASKCSPSPRRQRGAHRHRGQSPQRLQRLHHQMVTTPHCSMEGHARPPRASGRLRTCPRR